MRQWARWSGLTLYGDPDRSGEIPLHASGHASGKELVEFVQMVRPKKLIPIHTEDPTWAIEGLKGCGIEIVLPAYGKAIQID